jgi:hypothetical protein
MALLNVLAQWAIMALSIAAWMVGLTLLVVAFPGNYGLFKPLQSTDHIRTVAARISGRSICFLTGGGLLVAPSLLFAPVQWGATLFH